MRVLLIAEACNPTWSSTPLQAYLWYRHLRELADVTLVTQIRNRPGFEQAREPLESVHFIDTERLASRFHHAATLLMGKRTGVSLGMAASLPAYYCFETLVWQQFACALKSERYDVVHRLTPASPAMPSWLAGRSPVPFILGPLIGSLPWACGTHGLRRKEGEWLTSFRSAAKLLPYWRRTYARAARILLGTAHSSVMLWPGLGKKSTYLPWNGVDATEFGSTNGSCSSGEFRLLFVGRMTPLKQPAMLVNALAQSALPRERVRVTFVGDGPEIENVRSAAALHGLTERVTLAGWKGRNELVDFYRQADLLVLPSVHESGGAVLLEAMACGLPCAVLDYGGPGEYVNADIGFKVPLGTEQAMVAGFAEVFRHVYANPEAIVSMRRRCRAYIETRFDWPAKAQHLLNTYQTTRSATLSTSPS